MKVKAYKIGKNKIRLLASAMAVMLAAVFMGDVCSETVMAAGEEMYFGSDEYEWELYTSNPIGIYATADSGLEAVEYIVTYDTDMLEYDDDAGELIEEGRIQFESTDLNEDTYKLLLSFTPITAGLAWIHIRNIEVTEEGGEPVSLKSLMVPIDIPIPSGCHLDAIYIDGEELADFDTDTPNYSYRLEEYAEEVDVTVEPESGVEISDTHLEEGDNYISIMVENASGQKARYRVNVINPEQPEGADVEETAAEEESEDNSLRDQILANIYAPIDASNEDELTTAEEETVEEEIINEDTVAEEVINEEEAEEEVVQEEAVEEEAAEEAVVEDETFLRRVSRISSNFRVFTRNHTVIILIVIVAVIVVLFWLIVFLRNRRRHRKRTQKWQEERESITEDRNLEKTIQTAMEAEDKPLEIVVSGITMDFKMERDEPTSVKETVIRTLKRDRKVERFRALDNISFAVGEGDVVGIIGTNGSGKSTLLKIISGALIPTKGRVTVNRDKIQLLTLGTGFDRELTGRENVYLNGAIIGYTREFIEEKYDEIVKFAELEDFMDEKVRNYSSGMVSRLGFAIATIRDTPEILILDEVLSVGDIFFRKKSEARIQEMIHGGSTVLIVSHSMGVIRKNCNKAIWIEKGELRMIGDPDEVCKAYENMEDSEAVE